MRSRRSGACRCSQRDSRLLHRSIVMGAVALGTRRTEAPTVVSGITQPITPTARVRCRRVGGTLATAAAAASLAGWGSDTSAQDGLESSRMPAGPRGEDGPGFAVLDQEAGACGDRRARGGDVAKDAEVGDPRLRGDVADVSPLAVELDVRVSANWIASGTNTMFFLASVGRGPWGRPSPRRRGRTRTRLDPPRRGYGWAAGCGEPPRRRSGLGNAGFGAVGVEEVG